MGKDARVAYQHDRQVFTILTEVRRGNLYEISDLLDPQHAKASWVEDFVQTVAPGTTKSYLGSLVLLLEYTIASRKCEGVPRAEAAISELKRMQSRMRRKILQRRTVIETKAMGEFFSFIVV